MAAYTTHGQARHHPPAADSARVFFVCAAGGPSTPGPAIIFLMASNKTHPGKPASPPAQYDVVIVTTGPASQPESTPGATPLKTVVKKAFADLVITSPIDSFTYSNEAGRSVQLNDKVEDACDGQTDCKIFATPIKAQDA